jgi:hypothetical protein
VHQRTTDRVLIIKAKGGLGNRSLSAVTGLVLADLTHRTPFIDWRDGTYAPEGVNSYPLLFESPLATDCSAYDMAEDVYPAIWKGKVKLHPTHIVERFFPGHHSDPFIYRRTAASLGQLDFDTPVAVFWSYLPKLARLRRHLARDIRFTRETQNETFNRYLHTYFQPVADVKIRAEALLAGLPRPIIGVHVRYTDLKTPLDPIRNAIRRQLRSVPEASIFLSTDNLHVERQLREEFSHIVSHPKLLPETGQALFLHSEGVVEEAKNALKDMWTLAQCDWLIHAARSTFSRTGALMGGIPESRQTDVDRYNPKIRAKLLFQRYA